MTDRQNYIPAFERNQPMEEAAVGVVVGSSDDAFSPQGMVSHFAGWCDHAPLDAVSANEIEVMAPLQAYLGLPGLAAYAGLLRIGKTQAGCSSGSSTAAVFLFPREPLSRLNYHDYGSGRIVRITFADDPGDQWKGTLQVAFQYRIELAADCKAWRIR